MTKSLKKRAYCKGNTSKQTNRRVVEVTWLQDFLKANHTDPAVY